jgi:hypothetical protein
VSLEAGSDCEKPSVDIEGEFGHERKEEDIFEGNDGLEQDYMSRVALNFVLQSHLFYYTRYFFTRQ